MSDTAHVYRRRLSYVFADIGCVPPLFVLFVAFLFGGLARPAGLSFEVFFVGGLALIFGLMTARTHRHGVARNAIQVGPDGIWLPESGWLGWEEIDEVRLEVLVNRASASDPSQLWRRIGVMPRDERILAWLPAAQRVAGPLYRVFFNRFNPYTEGPPVRLAPFGVYEYEVADGLDPVLAAIAEYHAVTEHRGALAGMD